MDFESPRKPASASQAPVAVSICQQSLLPRSLHDF